MKVTNIQKLQRTSDNKPYWRMELEGKELPLLTFSLPSQKEGDDIAEDAIEKGKGDYWQFKRQPKPYQGKPSQFPKDDTAIIAEVAFKGAIDLWTHKHAMKPDISIDTNEILVITKALAKGIQSIIAEMKG